MTRDLGLADQRGAIHDNTYFNFGLIMVGSHSSPVYMMEQQIRMATNGAIVNTLVDGEPLFTTTIAGPLR